jgi:hypothetical protein
MPRLAEIGQSNHTQMLHGAGIVTYIYLKNCPKVNIPYMDHTGY